MNSEAVEYFEVAVNFIGRDWLETQRDRYYSDNQDNNREVPEVVEGYQAALQVLGFREEDDLFDTLQEEHELFQKFIMGNAAKLLYLGKDINILQNAQVVDLDGSPLDCDLEDIFQGRLHDKQEYPKARFELKVGAYYTKRGFDAHFLDEDAITQQSPDILLDFDPSPIRVECKKLDAASSTIVKERNLLSKLIDEVSEVLETRCRPKIIALLVITDEIGPQTLGRTPDQLPKIIDPDILSKYDLSFGKLLVTGMNVPGVNLEGDDIMIESDTPNPKHHQLFFDRLVRPRLTETFGIEASSEELLPQNIRASNQGGDENIHYWRDPIWIGCDYDFDYNFQKQLTRQIDEVGNKFRRGHPNIVNVDISAIGTELLPDWNLLMDEMKQEVEFTARISGTVISFEVLDYGEIHRVVGDIPVNATRYELLENANATNPLPGEFVSEIWDDSDSSNPS